MVVQAFTWCSDFAVTVAGCMEDSQFEGFTLKQRLWAACSWVCSPYFGGVQISCNLLFRSTPHREFKALISRLHLETRILPTLAIS